MNLKLTHLYLLLTLMLIVFTCSLVSIKYAEKYLQEKIKNKEKKTLMDKYLSFLLPSIALVSFFISCYLVSKSLLGGAGQYFGIYFILLVTLILFILNNSVLKDESVKKYLKGKKFSVIGMLMISGVSALVFGFIDNFGLSLGIEALDHKFLTFFLGPFSTDTRFIPEKKAIARNLVNINNWTNGKWRSVLNHVLRFKEDIRKIKGTEELMEDIDHLVNREGGRPLEIPKRIYETNQVKEFVNNIKEKYDIINDSKAMIGNTFSNVLGAILGAAIMNMFRYMTKYDGTYTGDSKIDDSTWVQNLNSYLPIIEGFFIAVGCLIPVFLAIAMKRDTHNNNNSKAWGFIGFISLVLLIMLFLSVKGVKSMNTQDKKHSLEKTLLDMKERLDISEETEPNLNEKINSFIINLASNSNLNSSTQV